MVGVAIIHTLFNAINTVLLIPFKKLLIKFCEVVVPDKGESIHTVFLDERLIATPAIAVAECKRLTAEMGEMTRQAIFSAIELVARYDEVKALEVREAEEKIDRYEDKLGTYLVKLSGVDLTDVDSHEVGRLLHTIGDFERISDHAVNIMETAKEIRDKNIVFSKEAHSEISHVTAAIIEIVDITVAAFTDDNIEQAANVEPLEQIIDELKDTLKARHIGRLQEGKCTIELGFVFNDLITNYERVSDHCSNIAVSTIQRTAAKQDAHKYLRGIKNDENGYFQTLYKEYEQKYLANL